MKTLKRVQKFAIPAIVLAALIAAVLMPIVNVRPAAVAATPLAGAARATAGTGGVTKGLFVDLSAAGTITTATAVTDSVVGVCELTAAAGAMTRYAPAGTQTTVTSGEAIAVGNKLTAGTGGKAFVLDTDDASTQHIAAIALTAATDADQDVTVIVCPSVAEQRLTLGGAVAISGANTFTTGTGAVTLAGDVTVASGKDIGMSGASTFTTGTGNIALNGDVTVASGKDIGMSGASTFTTGTGAVTLAGDVTVSAGKDISLAAGAGYIEALGVTTGGIRIDPIDAGVSTTTVVNSAAAAATTVTLPAVTGQLVWQPGGSVVSAADSLAIPITHAIVVKTTGADAEALTLANAKPGQVLTILLTVDGGGDGTLTPTTATNWSTIVFADAGDSATLLYVDAATGWVIVGAAGVAAPPVISYLAP